MGDSRVARGAKNIVYTFALLSWLADDFLATYIRGDRHWRGSALHCCIQLASSLEVPYHIDRSQLTR